MTCNVENKSVSGDEVTTLSLFAAAEGEGEGRGVEWRRRRRGKGEKEAREAARNFPKTLKIKFAVGHQDVLRVTTALHLGSRKIGGEGAKEIREKHA